MTVGRMDVEDEHDVVGGPNSSAYAASRGPPLRRLNRRLRNVNPDTRVAADRRRAALSRTGLGTTWSRSVSRRRPRKSRVELRRHPEFLHRVAGGNPSGGDAIGLERSHPPARSRPPGRQAVFDADRPGTSVFVSSRRRLSADASAARCGPKASSALCARPAHPGRSTNSRPPARNPQRRRAVRKRTRRHREFLEVGEIDDGCGQDP
jgi:hypothetical protein